jgi:hypothetical protein
MIKTTLYLFLSLLLIVVLFVLSWTNIGNCDTVSTNGTAIYSIDNTKVKAVYFTTDNITTINYYTYNGGRWIKVGQEKIDNANNEKVIDTFRLNDNTD